MKVGAEKNCKYDSNALDLETHSTTYYLSMKYRVKIEVEH